jgi:hypothetical protein
MGGISDPLEGFIAARVRRESATTEPDLHLLAANHNLDGFADMPMRHAISNRVDIHKTIGADASRQATGPDSERATGQGS